ncbi:MAG: HAD-IA family hydrolase, partial [Anaerolineae bacterium]|nr:HAD-IA family hydrolase [Anaerolineae bacterium]
GEAIRKFYEAGLTLAIASSSSEDYIRAVLHQMNWNPFIKTVASAYHVPRGKPAPDVYLEAARILKAAPASCLAFEDSVNGAKAAQAAQLRVCAVPGHDFTMYDFEGIADAVYPSLDDVLQHEFDANLPIE